MKRMTRNRGEKMNTHRNLATALLLGLPVVAAVTSSAPADMTAPVAQEGPRHEQLVTVPPVPRNYTGIKPVVNRACYEGKTLVIVYDLKRFRDGKKLPFFVEDQGQVQRVQLVTMYRIVDVPSVSGGEAHRRVNPEELEGRRFTKVRVVYARDGKVVPSDPKVVGEGCPGI